MITHPAAYLVFKHLARKWSQRILRNLAPGKQRFGELRRALPGISEKVLVETLREFERDGLVRREFHPAESAHVVYSLTGVGSACVERTALLAEWLDAQGPFFERARTSFDRAGLL